MDFFELNKKEIHNVICTLRDCKETSTTEISDLNFKTAVHSRHDLLHILLAESMGLKAELGVIAPIGVRFPMIELPEHVSCLTPDVVELTSEVLKVYDVTINTNNQYIKEEKMKKYKCLKLLADELEVNFKLSIISVKPSLENLLVEFSSADVQIPEKLLDAFLILYREASKIIESLKPYISDLSFKEVSEAPQFKTEFFPPEAYKANMCQTHLFMETQYRSDEDVLEIISRLSDDPSVISSLMDKKHEPEDFQNSFAELDNLEPEGYIYPKPTFHVLYCGDSPEIPNVSQGLTNQKDQLNCLNLLAMVASSNSNDETVLFLKEMYNNLKAALIFPGERRLFDTGFYTGTHEGDSGLKEVLAQEAGVKKKEGISLRKHNDKFKLGLNVTQPYFERSHQINFRLKNPDASLFDNKSGVAYKKKNPQGRIYKPPQSCSPGSECDFSDFIMLLNTQSTRSVAIDPIFNLPVGLDSNSAMSVKSESRESFKTFFKKIQKTHYCNMSYATMLFADQAIHYSSMNTKSTSYCMINTGLPNIMHIIHGGSLPRSKDVGQPFFTVALTTNRSWSNSVFGKHKVIPMNLNGKSLYLIVTSWRRLQIHKLSILRDQYYSCLSTGFDTYMRNTSPRSSFNDYIFFLYGFKSLVAQATSQRTAEFLMDVRYIVMSCYADYTNVSELIKDKFSPHYPTCFSRWIVKTLREKVGPIQSAYKDKGGFHHNLPMFTGDDRIRASLGGSISFPSLWGNYTLGHLQDLFDELFVYVLTGKEPSSQYHESIKSIETILKFQRIHDSLDVRQQNGIHDFNSLREGLIKKHPIFLWSDAIHTSANLVSKSINKPNVRKSIEKGTLFEVISELESTKACVPEYERVVDEDFKPSARDIESLRRHLLETGQIIVSEFQSKPYIFKGVQKGSPVNPASSTGRSKVHDLQLDMLIRHPEIITVLDVANWNIFKNSSRVEAHICIKAQYGAKREFYVVNYGAKAQVRVFENIFKAIAKELPNEMISVPGDRKMEYMSKALNSIIKESKETGDTIMYTNGDCTKWSACETMASFLHMVRGFSSLLTPSEQAYCESHLASWSNKSIRVPDILLQGTKFITHKTSYLNETGTIKSSQNFLQGMFNYSSSVKSVCATELAIKAWFYKWGLRRPIIVKHLEHSDDYVLITRVQNIKDFEDFRVMHKLCQRLHGIVDSEKKTNSQRFIMEFISLMCFNGQIAYPHIKKTKETGLNIAGLGYQTDIMTSISRSSESVRLGVPQVPAYIQSLLQSINIYRKYSLHLGGRNSSRFSNDPFNTPIELFGLPDCLPVFYLNTLGDPNNFRLRRYNSLELNGFFSGLYEYSKKKQVESSVYGDLLPTFKGFDYIYKRTGNRLKQIKMNIGWDQQKISDYLKENPEYVLMKPRESSRYLEWLQYMYYNKSFSTAYTMLSRRMIMLRLSFFSSGKCITGLDNDEALTLRQFINTEIPKLKRAEALDERLLNLVLLNGDPNIEAYFSLLDGAALIKTGSDPLPTSVYKIPETYKFLSLENNLATVLQYSFNYKNFLEDRRSHFGEVSLIRDKEKVMSLVPNDIASPAVLLTLQKLLKSQTQKYTVGISFSSSSHLTPGDMFRGYLEGGTNYRDQYQLITSKEFELHNPITGEKIYSRDFLYSHDRSKVVLENLSLMFYFIVVKERETHQVYREIVSRMYDEITGLNCIDFLKEEAMDMSKQSDIFHKRMLAILKSIVLGDDSQLYSLCENTYGIKHRYLDNYELQEYVKRGWDIQDAVIFNFKGINFMGVKTTEGIFTLTHESGPSTQLISILIARRLFADITQDFFERQLTRRFDYKSFLTTNQLPWVKGKRLILDRTGSILQLGECPLGFNSYSGVEFSSTRVTSLMGLPVEPECDCSTGVVWNGRVKLFSLPFWPCSSYQAVVFPDYKLKSGANTKVFNRKGLLHSYLHMQEVTVAFDEEQIKELGFPTGKMNLSKYGLAKLESNRSFEALNKVEQLDNLIGVVDIVEYEGIDVSLMFDDIDIDEKEVEMDNVEEQRTTIDISFSELEIGIMNTEVELDMDLDIDLENDSSSEQEQSSSSDEEKPFVQLLWSRNKMGFVARHVESLPPLHNYLMRCMTGYSFLRAAQKISGALYLIKTYTMAARNWEDYDEVEKALLNYSMCEVEDCIEDGTYIGQRHKIGHNRIEIEGYCVKVSTERIFYTERAARREAKGSDVEEDENGLYVVHKPSEEPNLVLEKLKYQIPRHKAWSILRDISGD